MTARRTFDKAAMPSRHVTEGTFAAPQRAFYYAMGLEADDIHRPLVGVVSAWDGGSAAADTPMLVAEAAEDGVTAGGATPRRFATVSDGASLIARELVADSVELTMRGHSYDAIVGVGATASSVAGLLMVAARLDVPCAIVPLVGAALGTSADDEAFAAAVARLGLVVNAPADLAGMLAAGRAAGRLVTEQLGDGRTARSCICGLEDAAAALAEQPYLLIHLVAIAAECGVGCGLQDLAGDAWAAGTLAPDGALVSGPRTVRATVGEDAVVAPFLGPRGGPGLLRAEAATDATLIVTDGWVAARDGVTTISAAGPEAAAGGPLGLLRDGDVIELESGRLDVLADLTGREPAPPPARSLPRGWSKYASLVGPANDGARTHPGAAAEVIRYAEL